VLTLAVSAAQAQDSAGAGSSLLDGLQFEFSIDYTSAYYFRGILQEDDGLIVQPAAAVSTPLGSASWSPTLTIGVWNSFHEAQTGADEDSSADSWYELDAYASLSFDLTERLSLASTYTAYVSPNDAFNTIHELAFAVSYDDGDHWGGDFAMGPYALVAVELDGSAFGPNEGVYLELGIAPGFDPIPDALSLSFPAKVGLSLGDYYESRVSSSISDDLFGYASVGAHVEAPLSFIGPDLGAWSVRGGVDCLFLGDHLGSANGRDDFEVIASFGVSIAF
jgi:hypothetical protein